MHLLVWKGMLISSVNSSFRAKFQKQLSRNSTNGSKMSCSRIIMLPFTTTNPLQIFTILASKKIL